jgi:heme A synthase
VFGPGPRIFAAVFSAVGAMTIFVGAAWSAFRYRRTNPRMLVSNLLIAAGTLVLSGSGILNSVLDEMDGFAVTLVVGISVVFAGFLVASAGATQPSSRRSSLPPTPTGSSETKVTLVGHL